MHSADAGELLARSLAEQGIGHAFCVPGESYLPLLAALPKAGIRVITCRHEGTASMAAEAMGRLTGRPGLCLVTRAPGAANAMAGVVVAKLDATPMLLLAGQVRRDARHGGAFQEAALTAMFAPLCKHVEEVTAAGRMPQALVRACKAAVSGTPGPVMLSLPEDMLGEPLATALPRRVVAARPAPTPAQAAAVVSSLNESVRPLLIAGGGPHLWNEKARAMLHELGRRAALPLITAFRRQGLVDARHEACAGTLGFRPDPVLLEELARADLLIVLGARANAVTGQALARAFDAANPPMPVVHIHPDPQMAGRHIFTSEAICATPENFLAALLSADLVAPAPRRERLARLHAAHLAFSSEPPPMKGDLDFGRVLLWLREHLPEKAIVTSGAGNYALWLHRFFHHHDLFGQLAPVAGSMGYGLPAALAAKLLFPKRPVVAVAGDGCFQMSLADFATAAQYRLGVIVLVIDNGQLGTIRAHQLRRFPESDCATRLDNPDFAAFAEACGGLGVHVRRTADFADAFREAEKAAARGRPALLHLHVCAKAIAPGENGA